MAIKYGDYIDFQDVFLEEVIAFSSTAALASAGLALVNAMNVMQTYNNANPDKKMQAFQVDYVADATGLKIVCILTCKNNFVA